VGNTVFVRYRAETLWPLEYYCSPSADCVMSSAQEFREYAQACKEWARTARSEQEREIFLEMAETWLVAAMRQEAGSPIPSKTSKPPGPAKPDNSSNNKLNR
jgi:hypothetical protein